jgi:hypothetical protein
MGAEILTLLNAKSCRLDGAGGGGLPSVTASDLAAAVAMANLPKGAWYLGLVLFCGQDDALRDFEYAIWLHAVGVANKRGWKIDTGKQQLRGISRVAMRLVVDPFRCRYCGGGGFNQHHKPCRRCAGSGMAVISQRQLAKLASIPQRTWLDTWAARCADIERDVIGWRDQLERGLSKQFENNFTEGLASRSKLA